MRAVRYDEFGDVDVLRIEDVERPIPGPGQVLVEIRAAAINPGEGTVRKGLLADKFPSTFPSGQGSDLAGVVVEVGPDADTFAVGDEVLGFTHDRASHADFVAVPTAHLVPRPAGVPWPVAGALYVAGTAAYASVAAVAAGPGDTVVVSGAAGGVGSIAVQLARHAGAPVVGIASEANHDWLAAHAVLPVAYGDGVVDRVRAAAGGRVDAYVDTFGLDYVEQALELGVAPSRINTIINFPVVEKYGIQCRGNESASTPEVLAELAALVDKGVVEVPIAAVYPLDEVRAAFQEVEQRHTHGKIVLIP